jgi:hypothetical protein
MVLPPVDSSLNAVPTIFILRSEHSEMPSLIPSGETSSSLDLLLLIVMGASGRFIPVMNCLWVRVWWPSVLLPPNPERRIRGEVTGKSGANPAQGRCCNRREPGATNATVTLSSHGKAAQVRLSRKPEDLPAVIPSDGTPEPGRRRQSVHIFPARCGN